MKLAAAIVLPSRRSLSVVLAFVAASLEASPVRAEPAQPPSAAAEQEPSPAAELPPADASAERTATEAPHGSPVVIASPARASVEPDRRMSEGPARYDFIRANAGFKIGYVPNRGFDTFASNDVLPQFSIDATYPLLKRGKLVLGVGLGWDVGGSTDKVRGFESSMTAHRLYVPVEGRYHVKPWLYGFGKIAAGVAVMTASVKDGTVPSDLSATGWAFSADASVGASILLGSHKHLDKRALRFWATPELGYAYTTDAPLKASSGRDDNAVLGTDESTNLRALALSGFFWRASIGATF